jgi:hypothetical protein
MVSLCSDGFDVLSRRGLLYSGGGDCYYLFVLEVKGVW